MVPQRSAAPASPLFGGRYMLLRRLAVGGMAEIYLARQAALAGFEKLVVIKRLRAEHVTDPRVVQMFVDEARIGALLGHPNIVHVYDVGEHEGVPYIAMEYIVGEELNELCRRGIAHKSFLPLEHAVELMRQAAAGMGYFHARRAEGGADAERPMEIVHLDISPSNLLVTQDGFLKIIDFGIASARGQRHRGDVIPGKLGYMSPEQAARRPIDHRSDIFSLGIVLYEITAGKRLFRGSARDVISKLTEGKIDPPTLVRRKFPAALEAIVMRALERNPAARYQSAYDLADDLEAFLRDAQLHSGPVRIARYLDALSEAAGGPRRPELVSEAETRGAAAAAPDGGRGTGEAYAPAATREWEDAEQPEADVAAALGLELAELRALRTPGPLPAGGPASGGGDGDSEADATVPLDRIDPAELERPSTATIDDEVPPGPAAAPRSAPLAVPVPMPVPMAPPLATGSGPGAHGAADHGRPVIGHPPGSLAPYSQPAPAPAPGLGQRLPWILVGALGMAVMALLAYIVVSA
jgi:tRNA A-37 threonylcarbamoyl transferase component Bud32